MFLFMYDTTLLECNCHGAPLIKSCKYSDRIQRKFQGNAFKKHFETGAVLLNLMDKHLFIYFRNWHEQLLHFPSLMTYNIV